MEDDSFASKETEGCIALAALLLMQIIRSSSVKFTPLQLH